MSAAFFQQVSRLHQLLDLDANGAVDREEARLGFTECFSSVHRASESLEGSPDALVGQQVSFLFSAADRADDPEAEVSEAELRECYQKLLAAAYEEEVMALDLKRAIDALEASQNWRDMREIFRALRAIYTTLGTQTLSVSDARHKAVLDALFAGITGRSNVLGPKKQTAARRMVAPYVAPEGSLELNRALRLFKELLALHIPPDSIKNDVVNALAVATGDSSASSSASASSPMDAN